MFCPGCGLKAKGETFERLLTITQTLRETQQRWHVVFAELRAEQQRDYDEFRRNQPITQPRGETSADYTQPRGEASAEILGPKPLQDSWTPKSVQSLLVWLGATLISIAALLFVAYAWSRLGLGGRTAIMAGVTMGFGVAGYLTHKRGLTSTSEALSAATIALTLIDAAAAYSLNLFGFKAVEPQTYWAFTFAVLACVSAASRAVARIHTLGVFALFAAQLPAMLVLNAIHASVVDVSIVFGVQALALTLAARLLSVEKYLPKLAIASAVTTWSVAALAISTNALAGNDGWSSILGIVALGAIAVAIAHVGRRIHPQWRESFLTAAFSAGVVAVVVTLMQNVHGNTLYISLSLLSVILLAGMTVVRGTTATAIIAATPAAIAALWAATPIAQTVTLALSTTAMVWDGNATSSAVSQLEVADGWGGVRDAVLVLLSTAGVVYFGGQFAAAKRTAMTVSAVLVVMAGYVALAASAAPFWILETVLVAASIALVFGARRTHAPHITFWLGVAFAVEALFFSLLLTSVTLLVLAAVAIAAAAFGWLKQSRTLEATFVTLFATFSWTFAATQALNLSAHVSGLVLISVAALVAVIAGRFRNDESVAAMGIAAVAATLGLAMTATNIDYLSVGLSFTSAAVAIISMTPHRRSLGWVSAIFGIAVIWTRLAAADVATVEAFTLPVAALTLFAGYRAARKDSSLPSWTAYGTGLVAALAPTLLQLGAGESVLRPAVLAWASLAILLAGAAMRLKAPVAIGAATLLITATYQLSPYAEYLPRWIIVGTIGALLIAIGATYERRLQQARSIRNHFASYR